MPRPAVADSTLDGCGAAEGDSGDKTTVEASESAAPRSPWLAARVLAPLSALLRPVWGLRARDARFDARPSVGADAGAPPAGETDVAAPNGGKPDRSAGLTTEAMGAGVAALPGAGGAGCGGVLHASSRLPPPAAGGGTGAGERPARAAARAALSALAAARDLGGIGSVAKSEMKKNDAQTAGTSHESSS